MSGTIEDKVNALFGLEPEQSEDIANETTEQTTDDINTPAQQPQADAEGNVDGSDKPAIGANANADGKQKPNDKASPSMPKGRLPANNNGDLIDPATGEVIAKAGKERQYFEAARNVRGWAEKLDVAHRRLRQEHDNATAQLQVLRERPKELGLETGEVDVAMKFMAHFKRDPVGAAKQVLTEVQAMGHTIEGLSAGLDPAVLKTMIDQAIAPFQQDRTKQQRIEDLRRQEQEANTQIDNELNSLFDEFPWTTVQQQEIHRLLVANDEQRQMDDRVPMLSLREAALQLQVYALNNGLDITKPIMQQLNAGQPQKRAPVNNARSATPNVSNLRPSMQDAIGGNTSASNRDVVRQAMREAGFNI